MYVYNIYIIYIYIYIIPGCSARVVHYSSNSVGAGGAARHVSRRAPSRPVRGR